MSKLVFMNFIGRFVSVEAKNFGEEMLVKVVFIFTLIRKLTNVVVKLLIKLFHVYMLIKHIF